MPYKIALATWMLLAHAACAQTVELTYSPAGAVGRMGYYEAQTCSLSATPPGHVMKWPAKVTDALYGVITLGPKQKPGRYAVMLSEASTNSATLYVDSNGDGDLTNDPKPQWKQDRYSGPGDSLVLERQRGSAPVTIKYDSGARDGTIQFYRLDPRDPTRANAKHQLIYYRDYGFEGTARIGDYTYRAYLSDDQTKGDFRGAAKPQRSGITLFIDVDGNKRFDRRTEAFDIRKPIVIGQHTLEVRGVSADGNSLSLGLTKGSGEPPTDATKPVPEPGKKVPEKEPTRDPGKAPPGKGQPAPKNDPETKAPTGKPNLAVGGVAPSFEHAGLDGVTIRFPEDYKGKVVLMDFWATWCRPCRDEIPKVVSTYDKWHDKGLEVIGISLDQADKKEHLQSFIQTNKMPWKQVYDGLHWKAKVAQTYEVRSIPAMFLVDGDTGRIIATGGSLRGSKLDGTVEKAVKAKKAQ